MVEKFKATRNFQIGDKVTTNWKNEKHKIIRTITHLWNESACESGILLKVDNGDICKCCGISKGKTIGVKLDSNWFLHSI